MVCFYLFKSGRRSRRNSITDDSQLTIENFGGSQDQINMIGRTLERERKYSNTQPVNIEQPVAVRSSLSDARGSIQLGYDTDSGSEKQDRETEKTIGSNLYRQTSMDNVSIRNVIQHSKEKDMLDGDGSRNIQSSSPVMYEEDVIKRKTTSFAALPTQTTWQQQSANVQQIDNNGNYNLLFNVVIVLTQ